MRTQPCLPPLCRSICPPDATPQSVFRRTIAQFPNLLTLPLSLPPTLSLNLSISLSPSLSLLSPPLSLSFFPHPRRHAPCCWRRVCTTSRPNSCAATLPIRLPGPITATCCPLTSTPPHPHHPRHSALPPPPPPSLCTGWAW